MNEFRYVRISETLISGLEDLVQKGENVVLLGPRNVGKRYVISRLLDDIVKLGRGRVGLVSFLGSVPEEQEVPFFSPGQDGATRLEPDPEKVIAWVDEQLHSGWGFVTLLAANVDVLPHFRMIEFLSNIRTRVHECADKPSRLVVVLTGELDLSRFTYGRLSEFNCCNQYVLQGFERAEFNEFASHFAAHMHNCIEFMNKEILEELYNRTGGNTYFLRVILWKMFDHHVGRRGKQDEPIRFDRLSDPVVSSQAPWNYYIRYVTRLIDGEPKCWNDLEALIRGEAVSARGNEPHLFELSGIAVREEGNLRLPGTLIQEFLNGYYTPRRLADHYAKVGEWTEAFDRYGRLDIVQRCRPTGLEDIADAEDVVKTFRTSLYLEATKGPAEVRALFADGCRYLLGFPEVTLWRFDQEWAPVIDGAHFLVPRGGESDFLKLLPPDPSVGDGYGRIPILEEQTLCVLPVRIPTLRPDVHEAIIVGTPNVRNIFSKAREQLTWRLVDDFIAAYSHAQSVRRDTDRLRDRERYSTILSEIVGCLGSEIKNVKQALEIAARGLRKLRYRRVLFSLINPGRTRIEEVVESADEVRPRTQGFSNYDLNDPKPAGQLWVVAHGEALVARDAQNDERLRNEFAREFGINRIAIIPLLDPSDIVLGTVLVEREDNLAPTREEIDDLLNFGRKLAVSLQTNEQITMLQTTLDRLMEPIAIFDQSEQLRYANKQAARYVDREPGWYRRGEGPSMEELSNSEETRLLMAKFKGSLLSTLLDGNRRYYHLENVQVENQTFNLATMIEPIRDWRDRIAGVLCHVRNESYLYNVFEAIRLLIKAGSVSEVIERTVEATKVLGHGWGRLYLVDPSNPHILVSKSCFGMDDPSVSARFNSGEYRLSPKDDPDHWETWHCIDDMKSPVVLHHNEEGEDFTLIKTRRGLNAKNCRNPVCPPDFGKLAGEFWIDFPLIAHDRVFGKLTLDCRDTNNPEDFEFLKVLCELTTVMFEEAIRREHDFKENTEILNDNMERVLRDVFHHIGTNLAAFPAILSRYRQLTDLEAMPCQYERVHEQFLRAYQRVQGMVYDTNRRLLSEEVVLAPADLIDVVKRSFNPNDLDIDVRLSAMPDRITMDLDATRLESALLEMRGNAKRCARAGVSLELRVTVECFQRQNRAWARIILTDNGRGVPIELKSRIFEPFFSSHPGGRRGFGFGLYFVKRTIEKHGGNIMEYGTEHEGASFQIEIPVLDGAHDPLRIKLPDGLRIS